MGLLILALVASITIAILFVRNPSPAEKGTMGEQSIANRIQKEIRLGLNGYVLRNLYIPKRDGSTSEIDILLVSSKGLFVIESKNYAGYIFGNDQRKYWTVSLYAGKNWLGVKQTRKIRFYNPVWQNRGHIKSLWKTIGAEYPTYSIIVFSDRSDLMNVTYNARESLVLQTSQLHSFFSSVRKGYPDSLTPGDMQNLYHRLSSYTQVSPEEKQAHVDDICTPKPVSSTCPRCGGTLVLRTARRGKNAGQQFFGCSNYPNCHYTRSIDP